MNEPELPHKPDCHRRNLHHHAAPWFMQIFQDGKAGSLATVYYCPNCHCWRAVHGSTEVPLQVQMNSGSQSGGHGF